MTDKHELWTLMGEAMQAFVPFYQMAMGKAIQDTGVPDNWFGLYLARGCEPKPFSVEHFQELAPFGQREHLVERLEPLIRAQLMERVGDDAYRLTDPGREAVEAVFQAAHQCLGSIEPLPADEMDQLSDLLFRIVAATLDAPEPDEKWLISYSRWTDPGEGAPGSVKIDQYLTDLACYRDDAHSAAWKPYGVGGTAWEAFTFVWRGDARTAEALAERLPFRRHSAEDYAVALAELAARGWVEATAEGYRVTEKGGALRQAAEDETDRFHYVGWAALNEDELDTLGVLLTCLKENLRQAAHGQIWSLFGELPRHFIGRTREVVVPLFEKHGLDRPGMFFVVRRVSSLAPDPITAESFAIVNPYSNQETFHDRLSQAAEAGLVGAIGDGKYQLTEKGRTALAEPNHAFYTRLGEIEGLPAEDLARLEELVRKIAGASLEAPEPAVKSFSTIVHNAHPSQEHAPLAKIDQHLDDLGAFRDDVHLAAWKPYGVSGQAWEALTLLWRAEAKSAEELQERLEGRGHSVETYQQALVDMAAEAWVEETPEGYQLTDKGRTIRQQAEELTDRDFYAPWANLTGGEIAQVHRGLTQLRDNLQQLSEGEEGSQ